MLYWAEGAKARNTIKFCNSDPNMLVFFRRFLIEALGVEPSRLSLSLHVYLTNGRRSERLRITGLSASTFRERASESTQSIRDRHPAAVARGTSCRMESRH
jgi:hypothetical protein